MCLVLGPSGTGKTLLLKTLVATEQGGDVPLATIPTVGTNLVNVKCKKHEVTLREVGGCMGPIWKNYFKDATGIIYVIDKTNRQQMSAACIQFLEILTADALKNKPVLVLLNKCDLPHVMTKFEFENIFQLEDIITSAEQPITVLDCSAKDSMGLDTIYKWIDRNASR